MKLDFQIEQLRPVLKLVALLGPMTALACVSFAATKMAITVDDFTIHGPTLSSESRLQIADRFLAGLKRHEVPEAVAFVNSRKVQESPETKLILQRWQKAGYPLGNHTYSHMSLNENSAQSFLRDVDVGEILLRELMPAASQKWFRYPYLREGDTLEKRNSVRAGLHKRGYKIAQVTVNFEDWAWNAPYVRCLQQKNQAALVWLEESFIEHALLRLKYAKESAKLLFGREVGHILLLHIGLFDSQMIGKLLEAYAKVDVELVSLAEASADPIFQFDPEVAKSRGETFLDQIFLARQLSRPAVKPLPLHQLDSLCRKQSLQRERPEI